MFDSARSPLGSEAIVDEALRQCIEFEDATMMLWEKHYGPNSREQVQELRTRWREELIADVDRMKGDASQPTDPAKVWGICVGGKIPHPLPTNIAVDTLVDSAMEACAPEEEQVREDYTRRHGATKAAAMVEQMQEEFRKFAVASIEGSLSGKSVR